MLAHEQQQAEQQQQERGLQQQQSTTVWLVPSAISVARRPLATLRAQVRLLLGCLFLKQQDSDRYKEELTSLSAAACADEDEWVRVMGAAVGDCSGAHAASTSTAGRAQEQPGVAWT